MTQVAIAQDLWQAILSARQGSVLAQDIFNLLRNHTPPEMLLHRVLSLGWQQEKVPLNTAKILLAQGLTSLQKDWGHFLMGML